MAERVTVVKDDAKTSTATAVVENVDGEEVVWYSAPNSTLGLDVLRLQYGKIVKGASFAAIVQGGCLVSYSDARLFEESSNELIAGLRNSEYLVFWGGVSTLDRRQRAAILKESQDIRLIEAILETETNADIRKAAENRVSKLRDPETRRPFGGLS
jgi:hypothetical protein